MTSLKRTVPRDLSKVFSNIVLISWRYSRNCRHCFFLLYFFIIIQAHVTCYMLIGKPLFMWSLNFILFLCDFNDSKKSYWLHGVNDTTKYFYDFVMTSYVLKGQSVYKKYMGVIAISTRSTKFQLLNFFLYKLNFCILPVSITKLSNKLELEKQCLR